MVNINFLKLTLKNIISIIILIYTASVKALTMTEALILVYKNNDNYLVIKNDFLQKAEIYPQSLRDGFIPKITSILSYNNNLNNTLTKKHEITIAGYASYPISLKSFYAVNEAKNIVQAYLYEYYDSEQQLLLKAINTYLECIANKEKYKIAKISVKANKTQFHAMQEKFKLGEATKTDLASTEAALAKAESNEAIAYAKIIASDSKFQQIFGIYPENLTMPAIPDNLPKNLEIFIEKALLSNPLILNNKNVIKSLKNNQSKIKSQLSPTIEFGVSIEKYYKLPSSYDSTTATKAKIICDIPILARGGAEFSQIKQAKYNTNKHIHLLESITKEIISNSKAVWESFNATQLLIESTKKSLEAYQIAYDGMIQEEMLGSKTILDVLNAEDNLNQAYDKYITAKKDLILRAYEIKALIGDLTAKKINLPIDDQIFDPIQIINRYITQEKK